MSFAYDTEFDREELLVRAFTHLRAVGFRVKTKGYILEAENGRDYSTLWCVVFLLLGITPFVIYGLTGGQAGGGALPISMIPFIIYWFTRKKNKIILDASASGKFRIEYNGVKALQEAERLANMFKTE